jgi:hypothetical protein
MIYIPQPPPTDWTRDQQQYIQNLLSALFELQMEVMRLKNGHQEAIMP